MSLDHAPFGYSTTLLRAVLALIAGAIVGAALVAVFGTTLGALRPWRLVEDAAVIFVYALVVWGAGLLLVAPLPWIILHRLGHRGWPVAVALGAVLAFLVVMALMTNGFGLVERDGISVADSDGPTWTNGHITAHGWAEALRFSALCGAAGALVGLAVWRVAYRRVASTS